MKIFAISDLHLSTQCDKPMDIFGTSWDNYMETITADWLQRVSDDDIVLVPGDLSWAMRLEDAIPDINILGALPGHKVILRGNHDYWWNGLARVRSVLPQKTYALQNDCLRIGDVLVCGTRGWMCPDGNNLSKDDTKIFNREVERLNLSLQQMQRMRGENDRVVAIMHYPPFNARVNDSLFVQAFVKNDVDTVVYGHLHGKDSRTEKHIFRHGINFYLTSCDIVGNKLVTIDEGNELQGE